MYLIQTDTFTGQWQNTKFLSTVSIFVNSVKSQQSKVKHSTTDLAQTALCGQIQLDSTTTRPSNHEENNVSSATLSVSVPVPPDTLFSSQGTVKLEAQYREIDVNKGEHI